MPWPVDQLAWDWDPINGYYLADPAQQVFHPLPSDLDLGLSASEEVETGPILSANGGTMGPTLSDCDSRRTMLATVTHSPVGIDNLNTPHEIEAAFSTVSSTASPRCPCGLPQQERNARTRVAEEKTSQIPNSNSHTPVVTASLQLQCKWEGCRYSGSFNGKASLVRHLQTEHMDLDTAPLRFQCKWKDCRYLGFFKRKGSLVRHLQTLHIDPLSHSCRVQHCEKAFNRKDNLVQHMLAHRQPY